MRHWEWRGDPAMIDAADGLRPAQNPHEPARAARHRRTTSTPARPGFFFARNQQRAAMTRFTPHGNLFGLNELRVGHAVVPRGIGDHPDTLQEMRDEFGRDIDPGLQW